MDITNEEYDEIIGNLHTQHPIEDMVSFNELDIGDKLQSNAMNVIRYKEFYYKELDIYEQLERKMDALIGMRYKHYRYNDDHNWQKPEIEKYCLPADEKIIKMKKIMARQKVKVRFFEMCWRALEKQGWNMKVFNDREMRGL